MPTLAKSRTHETALRASSHAKPRLDPLLELRAILQSYFDLLGYEIQQEDPSFFPPTADEFLYLCVQMNSHIYKESRGKQTTPVRVSTALQTVARYCGVPMPHRTFDTPCDGLFLCLWIACSAPLVVLPQGHGTFVSRLLTFAFPTLERVKKQLMGLVRDAIPATTEETARGISMCVYGKWQEVGCHTFLAHILVRMGIASCLRYVDLHHPVV
jgi:hypothetical protein